MKCELCGVAGACSLGFSCFIRAVFLNNISRRPLDWVLAALGAFYYMLASIS